MFWFKLHRVAASVVRTACDKSSCDVDFDEKRTTQHGIRMMGGISNSTKKKNIEKTFVVFLSCIVFLLKLQHTFRYFKSQRATIGEIQQ